MNQNLETLKKEQTQINLLKIQKEHAEDRERIAIENLFYEQLAHKNSRSWAKILLILLLSSISFSVLMICQASKLRAQIEKSEEQRLYNIHNQAKFRAE